MTARQIMMATEREIRAEFQRRVIVDLLGDDPTAGVNLDILRSVLAEFGQDLRVDEILAHAEWLAEAGLVEFAHRDPPVVLRATARCVDVAKGRIVVAGVASRRR